jgi:hypothetical protein
MARPSHGQRAEAQHSKESAMTTKADDDAATPAAPP